MNRLTANKSWIFNLIHDPYIENQGEFESNYIEVGDKKISRINLISTVVNKFESEDKNYISLTLDDGTEEIRIKTWKDDTKLTKKVQIGDIILVIGKIRKYNDERYINPEIIKTLNINWEIARKLELIKIYGKPTQSSFSITKTEEEQVIEEISFSSNNLTGNVLNLIEKYEDKDGITLEELKKELNLNVSDISKVLNELIKEGQVYSVGHKFRLLV